MGTLGEEEVHAVRLLLDPARLGVRAVLQDNLLDEVDRALVGDFLAELHHGAPRLIGDGAGTQVAGLICDREVDDERLLHNNPALYLLLDLELQLDAARVWLGPLEPGVHELHPLPQPWQFLEAERQQFGRFPVALFPWRPEVAGGPCRAGSGLQFQGLEEQRGHAPPTAPATMQNHLLRNAIRDVDLLRNAGGAHVHAVGLNCDAT